MLTWIAFDADDTLWENELYYKHAQEKLMQILSAYHPSEITDRVLLETETRNIPFYGYGIKSFGLIHDRNSNQSFGWVDSRGRNRRKFWI